MPTQEEARSFIHPIKHSQKNVSIRAKMLALMLTFFWECFMGWMKPKLTFINHLMINASKSHLRIAKSGLKLFAM
jgi:hypothetical protein